MSPRWLDPLLRRLAEGEPRHALVIAPEDHALVATLRARLPQWRLELRAQPGTGERQALALVAGTLEQLDAPAARACLAALRDRLASHTVVWLDLAVAPLDEAEMRALGFRLHARDGDQALFGFDAYDYKDRPEWLNPRHWAHPELWDRYRW